MVNQTQIAQIDGKTTPFGFEIKLFTPIHRNTYLAVDHEENSYILAVSKLWNDQNGAFARVQVVGEIPLTPFPLDSVIYEANPDAFHGNINDVFQGHLSNDSMRVLLSVRLGSLRVLLPGGANPNCIGSSSRSPPAFSSNPGAV